MKTAQKITIAELRSRKLLTRFNEFDPRDVWLIRSLVGGKVKIAWDDINARDEYTIRFGDVNLISAVGVREELKGLKTTWYHQDRCECGGMFEERDGGHIVCIACQSAHPDTI